MSTTRAIVDHTQYLYDTIDRKQYILSIFLDFAKAFDTVDHSILLSKLQYDECHMLGSFHNYQLENSIQGK